MRQIILDTETTGLRVEEGHRIIEIGCLEMVNRKLTGRHYHQFINPQREVEAGALAVHGISNEFLADKPVFNDILQALMDFISGAELIIMTRRRSARSCATPKKTNIASRPSFSASSRACHSK